MNRFARLLPTASNPDSISTAAVTRIFTELGRPAYAETQARWGDGFRLLHGALESQRQADLSSAVDTYGLEIESKDDFLRLVLALETYYCVVLLALGSRAASGVSAREHEPSKLFDGTVLRSLGIFNYRCPEPYHWIVDLVGRDSTVGHLLDECDAIDLADYDRDLVKHLFQGIFHRKLRHSLGEIYTPDWLAQLTVTDATQGDIDPSGKIYLDPTCGSGTFLVEVLRRHLDSTHGSILRRVHGIDINPVSALAAKTNILLIGAKYLGQLSKPFWIPVYEADCLRSVFSQYGQLIDGVRTTIPGDLLDGAAALVKRGASLESCFDFLNTAFAVGDHEPAQIEALAAQLVPEALHGVHYVIGNPPWVNWEYLPEDYKRDTAHIWQYYRLFDLRGRDSTFIKEDISALVTYVAADKYLASDGVLAFVIKQSLFKSSRQGEGFRQFRLVQANLPLQVIKVEDLSAIRAFSGVATRAAVLLLRKGAETTYPVEYNEWQAGKRASFREEEELNDVLADVVISRNHAFPVESDKPTSGWTTSTAGARSEISSVLGTTCYRARTGLFTGGLNAAFWMRILHRDGDAVRCRNIVERAKNKLPEIEFDLEPGLLFPFVTGAEVDLWSFRYSRYILCTHTKQSRMEPLPENELQSKFPLGFSYLDSLRSALAARKGFAGWEKSIHERYYYALQRIGDYTFAPYKVAWRFISSRFLPVVIGPVTDAYLGQSIPIPNEKVIFVGLESSDEAYYLCGVLSSTLHRRAVESFMVQTQIGPHVLDKLAIQRFDPENPQHACISRNCRAGHSDPSLVAESIAAIDKSLGEA